MQTNKHFIAVIGIAIVLSSVLIMSSKTVRPSDGTAYMVAVSSGFSSQPISGASSSQFSSQPISTFSASSISLASFSASSISISNPISSVSFSSVAVSSQSIQSQSFSSVSFSQSSFSSFSFSASSLSIPRSSFSSTSLSSGASSAQSSEASSGGTTGGDQGTTGTQGGDQGTTGTQGGTTGGSQGGTTGGSQGGGDFGNFGGLIGIGGSFGGGGGVSGGGTTGGGGGSRPKPSADSAKAKDCFDKENPHKRTCIPLIQPLGSKNTLAVKPGAQTFIDYFNEAVDLLMTVAVGFCVLWILIGSYMVMISGSDGGKRSEGKSMITWALIGLILVNFAGFFLRTLNSIFFT